MAIIEILFGAWGRVSGPFKLVVGPLILLVALTCGPALAETTNGTAKADDIDGAPKSDSIGVRDGARPPGVRGQSRDGLREDRAGQQRVRRHRRRVRSGPLRLRQARAARGLSNRLIGGELHISGATVKRHLANVYEKVGVRSRNGAVRKALSEQWIGLHEIASPADDGDGPHDGATS